MLFESLIAQIREIEEKIVALLREKLKLEDDYDTLTSIGGRIRELVGANEEINRKKRALLTRKAMSSNRAAQMLSDRMSDLLRTERTYSQNAGSSASAVEKERIKTNAEIDKKETAINNLKTMLSSLRLDLSQAENTEAE